MENSFQFKQFKIEQDLCAMKVGTDGVLIGAWTNVPNGNVLDVGCGSGLISLMIAQRNLNCEIDAIDIEKGAFYQTELNIKNSSWNSRIKAFLISFQDFKPSKKYDLIISNPPFFINSFKTAEETKTKARHTDELPFEDFISKAKQLLELNGILSIILPANESNIFCTLAKKGGLFLNRKCEVKPNYEKPVKRILMEFSFFEKPLTTENLTIETNQRHQYTEQYRNLTKDFYLKF